MNQVAMPKCGNLNKKCDFLQTFKALTVMGIFRCDTTRGQMKAHSKWT